MSSLSIWFDYQIFAVRRYNGISRYFIEVAARIHHYPQTKVRIVAPFYMSKFLAEQSSAIPVLGLPFTHDIKYASGIIRRLDAVIFRLVAKIGKPDIVHETYYSRARRSNTAAKIVLTVYDTIEELFTDKSRSNLKTIGTRQAALSRADQVICISESTRNDLLKFYEVDPEKVSVIHLASSMKAPADAISNAGDPYLLYVGSRGGYKNFLGFLVAFAASLLYETHRLVCFGGGELTESERQQIMQLHIPDGRVQVISGDDAMLSGYYASAEAFVYPSLYEGFGIPLLEAMGCGCPVICSNTSSFPEVAGDAAVYFDPEDTQDIVNAMMKVVQSSDQRRRMIARGELRIKEFSWDICALQTFKVYEKLLSKK